jgi:hypothetical protein
MSRLTRVLLLLLAVSVGSYGVGVIEGWRRPLEHAQKPWVVRALGL